MSKRTTGELIASDEYAMDAAEAGPMQTYLAERIDRAIRRAQAKAWDEGFSAGCEEYPTVADVERNPYRGRAKR